MDLDVECSEEFYGRSLAESVTLHLLGRSISFFGLRIIAFLTRSTFSSDLLGRPVECLLSTLPFFLMLLSSSGLTPYSRLNSRWNR
jgi:hypothetical protein